MYYLVVAYLKHFVDLDFLASSCWPLWMKCLHVDISMRFEVKSP